MSLFTLNAARHRAETTSHVVRNTTIAAPAAAAMVVLRTTCEVVSARWRAAFSVKSDMVEFIPLPTR